MKTFYAASYNFYAASYKKIVLTFPLMAVLFVSGITPVSAQNNASRSDNLPVLLMSFSGGVSQNNIILSWTMENQTNCKYFVIERSANGNNFDSIDVVEGLNNMHESDYSYTDLHSLNGSNFYRLCQVNRDGVIKYSKVISLDNKTAVSKMQVFPNPAGAVVNYTVTSSVSELATVQVFNLAGIIVLSRQQQLSAGFNQQSLAISTLKSGNYFLKVVNREGNNRYVQSFVKML